MTSHHITLHIYHTHIYLNMIQLHIWSLAMVRPLCCKSKWFFEDPGGDPMATGRVFRVKLFDGWCVSIYPTTNFYSNKNRLILFESIPYYRILPLLLITRNSHKLVGFIPTLIGGSKYPEFQASRSQSYCDVLMAKSNLSCLDMYICMQV